MKFLDSGLLILALVVSACGSSHDSSDAFGNFEATETVISSEAAGRLLEFKADEGRRLEAGAVVAVVDTTQLVLKRAALRAQRHASASRVEGVLAQLELLQERQQIAARELRRFENLVRQDAAAAKQVDEINDQIRVLEREMSAVRTQLGTIRGEIEAVDAQIAQVDDQIARSVVINPVSGVVLTTYAEPYELAMQGKPLYRIADLDTLVLRAYVSGGQLPSVRLGAEVAVIVDDSADEVRTLPGSVSWIASDAEFTPRFIQTREERVNLVYAVKVRVPNLDGRLKIGMPGEVRFLEE